MKHEEPGSVLRSQLAKCDRYFEKNWQGANETRASWTLGANETRDFVASAVQRANETRGRE